MKKLKRNLAQLKENVLAAVALALFLSIGVGSVTVLSGHWQIPRLWQAAANYIINLVADRLHKNLSYDAIAIFFSAFLLRLLPRLMELIKAVATVVVNLMSMCFSVVAAISFGWMDEDGQVPFAVQWFLIAADKRDSADLLADLEDLYPTWVKQRGPIKAAWLCYARLFSYYGHRLIAKLSAPRRRSAR